MHGKTSAADFSIVWCHYRFGFICINRANTSEVNPFSSQSYTISIWMHRGGRGKANRIRQGNYENWKTPFYHGEHVREEHKFHSSYRTPAETTIRREQYLLRAHQSMQQEKSQTQDDNRTTKDIKGSGVAGAVSSEQRAASTMTMLKMTTWQQLYSRTSVGGCVLSRIWTRKWKQQCQQYQHGVWATFNWKPIRFKWQQCDKLFQHPAATFCICPFIGRLCRKLR